MHQRVLEGFHRTFFKSFLYIILAYFLTLQISIFIIAEAVEINFVSYNEKMLQKDVLGKLSLCAPFYRPYVKVAKTHFIAFKFNFPAKLVSQGA